MNCKKKYLTLKKNLKKNLKICEIDSGIDKELKELSYKYYSRRAVFRCF